MKRIFQTLSQKWPEYLLEGIVIVCSILLAIGLENWNDDQKELKLEAAFLSSINVEFRKNQKQFEEVVGAHKQAFNTIENLVAEMQKDDPNPDSINFYSKGVWKHYTFNPSQTSIRSLTSGSVQIIRNEELRNLLLGWSDMLEDYTEEEQTAKKNFEERIRPYLEKNFEVKRWFVDGEFIGMHDISSWDREFENILLMRRNQLYNILEADGERLAVENAINRIIELTD
jgi:hypothetical protein